MNSDSAINDPEKWRTALPRKQKKPLKKTAKIIEQSPKAVIYAMDEASIKREATISHGWYPKGKTPVVMSPATKEKINIVGAVKIGSGNLVHQKVEHFRKEQMIDFLELLLEEEKDSKGRYTSFLIMPVRIKLLLLKSTWKLLEPGLECSGFRRIHPS
jgi:hypothetical protein